MSNKKYAFIDEFGAFGYDFENPGCTTHFLIGAVIVDERNLLFRIFGKNISNKEK